jgi:hypothetical protein
VEGGPEEVTRGDWSEYVELPYADKDIMFSYPPQSDWFSFETAAGKRTKPHMLARWDGVEMVFACGVRTVARQTCAEPILFGVPEFGVPPTYPMKPDIVGHEQVLADGSAVRLPEGACALCAHEKEKAERAWYDEQAKIQTRINFHVTKLGHVKLSGLFG